MADVSYMSSLPSDDRQHYIEKMKDLGDLPEEKWVNDPRALLPIVGIAMAAAGDANPLAAVPLFSPK